MKKKTVINISALPIWIMGKDKGMPSKYESLKGFVREGWEVYYLFSHSSSNRNGYKFADGIHIYNLKIPFKIIQKRVLNMISAKVYWVLFSIISFVKGLILAIKIKPSIIYAHTPYAGLSAFCIAKLLHIPVIFRGYGTLLSLDHLKFPRKIKVLDQILTLKLPYDKLVLTNDGTGYDKIAKKLGIPDEKILFLINGVDKNIYIPNFNQERFKQVLDIEENKRILLTVSRLVGFKHVERIIKAIPEVVKRYPMMKLLIVGDGLERKNLENLADKLKIKDYVRFLGALSHDKLKNYYNVADIFISMYDFSNVGNPLLEAMSCGKCIITLDVGDTNKFIQNKENGVLLKLNQLNQLPDTIMELLNNEKQRRKLGRNAKTFAEKNFWTWEERMNVEIKEIEKLLKIKNNG